MGCLKIRPFMSEYTLLTSGKMAEFTNPNFGLNSLTTCIRFEPSGVDLDHQTYVREIFDLSKVFRKYHNIKNFVEKGEVTGTQVW